MKLYQYCIFALAPLGTLGAATLTFEDPSYVKDTPLTNSSAWGVSESSPANMPMAWTAPWRGNKAGAVGGYFNAPVASTFSATLVSPAPLSSAFVSFDMTIVDSSNDYPGRDSFGFAVSDSLGGTLALLTFSPVSQSDVPQGGLPAQWNVSYAMFGGVTVDTTISLIEGGEYFMNLSFLDNEFNFTFGNNVSSYTFTESDVDYDVTTQSIGGVAVVWNKTAGNADFGDNYMLVDNITVVPEPSVTLLGGLGALLLLGRRRRL